MRSRYKAPGGTGVLDLADEATVEQLLAEIESKTGHSDFVVKYGWPPKVLDTSQKDVVAKSLGLHGETLTIVPNDAAARESEATPSSNPDDPAPPASTAALPLKARSSRQAQSRSMAESAAEVTVPWPAKEGTLSMGLSATAPKS